MNLSPPARPASGLPLLNARYRSAGTAPHKEDQLSAALLSTGVFPLRASAGPPRAALNAACASLSRGASGDARLSAEPWEQGGQALLSLRYRQVTMYSFTAARPALDKVRRGLLGRLLSDLRRAAAPHAPIFTPETVLDDQADRHGDQETLLYEALAPRLRGMTDAQITAALRNVSPRDAAKIIARQGYTTYLQAHEAGATLGLRRLFTRAGSLDAEVAALPPALVAQARAVQGLTAALQQLPEPGPVPPGAYDDQGDRWGPLIHPAFLVIASTDAQHDPVSEALNEQWQLCCEYAL